ncbi:hypothetical protein [Mesorhizobium australicum]|uniref:hypothetical protein n=1 Tax=Mesorhizobium australicum TaxID=536018 RepID=UPI001594CD5F|nr:hypothetical protein [Mesorhizobium australicum]
MIGPVIRQNACVTALYMLINSLRSLDHMQSPENVRAARLWVQRATQTLKQADVGANENPSILKLLDLLALLLAKRAEGLACGQTAQVSQLKRTSQERAIAR